jgi:ketosteroid isomerase-like protein
MTARRREQTMTTTAQDKEAIIAIVKEMAESMTGEQSTQHWASDVLWFDIPPYASRGVAPARKLLDDTFGKFESCTVDILELGTTVNGDMGIVCTGHHPDADPAHDAAPGATALGTPFVTAGPRASVAGYDLTFSPVKSVSALWALADPDVAGQIEAAHAAAVADVIGWLERTVVDTRLGTGGIRQVDVTGLLAVAFTDRDSRTGDPDLHTHVAISNKVRTLDGRWRALDGRPLHAAERRDAEVAERLGRLAADTKPRGTGT